MRLRRTFLPAMGLAAVFSLPGILSAQTGTGANTPPEQKTEKEQEKKATIGEAAPDFTLQDAEGKEHKLSDYKGKIVVLQWINPKCPVCVRVHRDGLVAAMREQLKELDPDVVHLTINTTHGMKPEMSAQYLEKHEIDAPALIDDDGTVGRLYGAKTTPHMFVIDEGGILRYDGAFDDDDPRGRKGKDAKNHAVSAVKQIKEGETVTPDTTEPYGCDVKYARGS